MVINIDLTEQSRAAYSSNRPLGTWAPPRPTSEGGLHHARPRGRDLHLARPLGAGSASPDPEAAIFASSDPWVCSPSRLTGTHTAANHSRSKRMALGQNSYAREEAGTPRCNPWP